MHLARALLAESLQHDHDWLRQRQAILKLPDPTRRQVSFKRKAMAGVPVLRCAPKASSDHAQRSILYFHGGGFVVGSCDTYRNMLAQLATRCNMPVVAVDYRLAPEHSWQEAVEDCLAVTQACLANGGQWVLAGDSAGGNLVLQTMAQLTAAAQHDVVALVLLSPWLVPGESAWLAAEASCADFVSAALLQRWAQAAGIGHDSALREFGNDLCRGTQRLPQACPCFVQSGARELMAPQIAAFVSAQRQLGVAMDWQAWAGQPHVFQTLSPMIAEASLAVTAIADWLAQLDGFKK